jgi:hypothetical protein
MLKKYSAGLFNLQQSGSFSDNIFKNLGFRFIQISGFENK